MLKKNHTSSPCLYNLATEKVTFKFFTWVDLKKNINQVIAECGAGVEIWQSCELPTQRTVMWETLF